MNFRWHWFNRNERPDGTTGLPFEGRATGYLSEGDPDAGGRDVAEVALEWNLLADFVHAQLAFGSSGSLKLSLGLGPTFWLKVSHPSIVAVARGFGLCDREVQLSYHDAAIWWTFLTPRHHWDSKWSWWKNFTLHLDDLLLGKQKYESQVMLEEKVLVPMPERSYKGTAKVVDAVWKRPRWFAKRGRSIKIDMDEGEQVPIPGKGESGYDCGEDAYFGGSYPGRSIAEGVGSMVASALERRRQYGGRGWLPEAFRAQVEKSVADPTESGSPIE